MPLQALTVALNSNHSRRFVFNFQDGTPDPKACILKEARNKFRVKALSRVFLPGGVELGDEELLDNSVHQLFVSKGEGFIGRTQDPPNTARSRGEVRIIAEKSYIDDRAVAQLNAVASLEGVHLACGMPDLHPGDRFPVGCAIIAEGVYPALIGSDIGCGIGLYKLSSSSRSADNPPKIAAHLKGLDNRWDGPVSDWLLKYGIENKPGFEKSLGSIGLGNHFAEICTVERVIDEVTADHLSIQPNGLYLLVHTGSRGIGSSILADATRSESNPYLAPDSSALPPYLLEHDYAIKWAVANRDLVAYRVQSCLFSQADDAAQDFEANPTGPEKILDVTHNSVSPSTMDIAGETKQVWIHRKGAAPADCGVTPCPGSRGDFSWLVKPRGDGLENAHSLAHGAGRRHPRHTLHTFSSRHPKSSLTTTSLGSEVVCTDPDLLIEEMPQAYKDIQCVIDDMEEKGVCKGVVVLRPVVSYKVREGGYRDKK